MERIKLCHCECKFYLWSFTNDIGFGHVVLGRGGKGAFVFSVGFVQGVVGVGNFSCIGQSSLKEDSTSLQVIAFVEFVYS
jgi:hypothetical protein